MTQLPSDSDIDLHLAPQRAELRRAPWAVLGAIAGGGALGASARYGLAVAFPTAPPGFPWTTFVINTVGCLFLGALMVLVTQVWSSRPLLRPLLGVGVLGGFTTFSTYAVELRALMEAGALKVTFAYLVGTLLAALGATWVGLAGTRWLVHSGRSAA